MTPATNVILSWGGIGDALLTTPLLRAIKEQQPNSTTIVYSLSPSHHSVFLHNPYIDKLRLRTRLTGARVRLLNKFRPVKTFTPNYAACMPSLVYSKNVTEIIAEMFGVTLEHKRVMLYLTPEEEEAGRRVVSQYATPIAIHVTSSFSTNQAWPTAYWTELVRRNPQYTFLQLGLPKEQLIPGVVDLRGKLPLREQFAVLKYSQAFVGVASGFAHATNAFATPGVVFYGPASSSVWGHANNRNLDLGLSCAPCIEILWGAPCPYGAPCMSGISVSAVEHALEQQLA
jgi:ADP-heptose:LPS heptosyltransferase